MRAIRFLLFILLCFTITCAWADIAPRPGGVRPFRPPVLPQVDQPESSERPQATVSMAAANVRVRIRDMQPEPGTNEKGPGLLADVTSEFDLKCSAAPQKAEDLDLVFPLIYMGESSPQPVRLAVSIDGKRAANVRTDTWPATDEAGRVVRQWGYAWRLPGLKSGQKRRIAVQYSLVLPQSEGKANFIYILRSGAKWDGPIGEEVVNVTAEKGLRMEILTPTALKPEHRTDTSLTWRITNAKPAEDIRLVIVSGAKP